MAMLVVGYFCVSDVYVRAVCCHGAEQEACVCTSAVVYIAPFSGLSIVCGHITEKSGLLLTYEVTGPTRAMHA